MVFKLLACIAGFRILLSRLAVAQQPPSTWRKPSIITPIADRISLVRAALDVGNVKLGSDGQFSGASTTFIVVLDDLIILCFAGEAYDIAAKFYLQMAAYDIATNGTQFHRPLLKLFSLAEGVHANFSSPNSG
ncbi:hypothetical protein B0H19DRAFT_1062658 [Mycena capillaripes]|nr:hypothetical protein B0H19DRAFT_1062658 [Mycena capillaripes]